MFNDIDWPKVRSILDTTLLYTVRTLLALPLGLGILLLLTYYFVGMLLPPIARLKYMEVGDALTETQTYLFLEELGSIVFGGSE